MSSILPAMTKFSHTLIAGATALSLSITGPGVAFAGSSFGSSDRGATVESIPGPTAPMPSAPTQPTQPTQPAPKPVDLSAKINTAFHQAFVSNGFTYNPSLLPYAKEGLAAATAGTLAYEGGTTAKLVSDDYKAVIIVYRLAKANVTEANLANAANVKMDVPYTAPFALSTVSDETYYYVSVATQLNPNQVIAAAL